MDLSTFVIDSIYHLIHPQDLVHLSHASATFRQCMSKSFKDELHRLIRLSRRATSHIIKQSIFSDDFDHFINHYSIPSSPLFWGICVRDTYRHYEEEYRAIGPFGSEDDAKLAAARCYAHDMIDIIKRTEPIRQTLSRKWAYSLASDYDADPSEAHVRDIWEQCEKMAYTYYVKRGFESFDGCSPNVSEQMMRGLKHIILQT